MARVSTDQAQGLRQLFAAEEVRVVALTGRHSQSVAAALALALTAQNNKVMLVDEELCAGGEHPLLGGLCPWMWDRCYAAKKTCTISC